MLSAFCSHSQEKGNAKWAEEEASEVQDVFPADTGTLRHFFHFIKYQSQHPPLYKLFVFRVCEYFLWVFFHLSHKIVSDTQFFLSILILWLVLWVMCYLHLTNINRRWVWISKQPNQKENFHTLIIFYYFHSSESAISGKTAVSWEKCEGKIH